MRTILRVSKNLTTISNIHLRDINLSWDAKGLLTYLLTLDDTNLTIKDLGSFSKDGPGRTRTLIKELIEAGYIEREALRNGNRIIGNRYNILEKRDV